jgi:hypothetical protein
MNSCANLELVMFSQYDQTSKLASVERKRWMLAFLFAPSSTKTAVPNDESILQSGVEMKRDISTGFLMSQVNCKPAAAAAV